MKDKISRIVLDLEPGVKPKDVAFFAVQLEKEKGIPVVISGGTSVHMIRYEIMEFEIPPGRKY